MKRWTTMVLLFALLAMPAFALHAEDGDKGEAEHGEKEKGGKAVKVEIKDLPKAVVEAAQKAYPGIVLTEAEKATRGDTVLYEVDGKVGDKLYELVITAEGKVLRSGEKKAEKAEKAEGGDKEKGEKKGDDDDKNEKDDDDDDDD